MCNATLKYHLVAVQDAEEQVFEHEHQGQTFEPGDQDQTFEAGPYGPWAVSAVPLRGTLRRLRVSLCCVSTEIDR